MPSLQIPEAGVSMGRAPGRASTAGGPGVVGLSLTDAMIEEMIKCVQNGKGLQLSLGEHPSILYGSKVQHLVTSDDPFAHDLYRSTVTTDSDSDPDSSDDDDDDDDEMDPSQPRADPRKGTTQAPPRTNTAWLASVGAHLKTTKVVPKSAPKPAAAAKSSAAAAAPTATDAALAQLTGALASESQKKQDNTTKVIDSLVVPGRKGGSAQKATNKSKFLSQNRALASGAGRSMPTSPALNSALSPARGPASVPLSQQNAERSKEARKPVIHLLAVEPLTEASLRAKLPDLAATELDNALRKVGDLNETTRKWELRKGYWKELDVWTFQYAGDERQRAIDNAVKQFDKMRLGASEPEWERLLVRAERGTGKCLSKLQADIAARTLARSSKPGDASGRDTPSNGDEDLKGDGARSSSQQPPSARPKKPSEKEAQVKRLFSTKPGKAASKPAPRAEKAGPKAASRPPAKSAAPRTSSLIKKAAPARAGTKVLSAEYVEDSDEDDPSRPPPRAPTTRLAPTPKPAIKRSREGDDHEPSDRKRPRKDVPPVVPGPPRVSDASQASRTTTSSHSAFPAAAKHKGNSPPKSSPLASSPPTNASDMESLGDRTSSSASPGLHLATKNSRSPIYKRHTKSSSVTSSSSSGSARVKPEAITLAAKYKLFYPRYVELFEEVLAEGDNRTDSKERDLLDMHERLEDMRRRIIAMVHDN